MLIDTVQETAGTSYQEYTLSRAETERISHTYVCCTEEFTNLFYRLYFNRPSQYYFMAVEFPSLFLTFISMIVFWLDATNCGERLGFGKRMHACICMRGMHAL